MKVLLHIRVFFSKYSYNCELVAFLAFFYQITPFIFLWRLGKRYFVLLFFSLHELKVQDKNFVDKLRKGCYFVDMSAPYLSMTISNNS